MIFIKHLQEAFRLVIELDIRWLNTHQIQLIDLI